MEGPKPFEAKPPNAEDNESAETIAESIERALETHTELMAFNNIEVKGEDAMVLNAQAEALATELKAVLRRIPAKQCMENGLPYHPTDEKVEVEHTPFPAQPDYPLDYTHQPSGSLQPERFPRADELDAVR